MKTFLFAAFAAFSIHAVAVEENLCEFEYRHQMTIHHGDVPTYYCYAILKRVHCPEGYKCGAPPAMMPQQCGFPPEIRKRRCIHNSVSE